jgi:hypothetical protein
MKNKKFAGKTFNNAVIKYWPLFLICALLITLIILVLIKLRIAISTPRYFIYPIFG